MFPVKFKPGTIERLARERALELTERRAQFESNVALAKAQYPQFPWPATLPESNVMYLEAGPNGPKGWSQAITVNASRIKFEDAF